MDGSTAGGTLVTLTAFLGVAAVTADEVQVTFPGGGVATSVAVISSDSTGTVLTARTPAASAAGDVTVTVSARGVAGDVAFSYFLPPTIRDVQPRRATLRGNVASPCVACLADDDARTISVWVANFPPVTGPADVMVSIGDVLCSGASAPCVVRTITTLATALYLTVSVPPAASPFDATVTVTSTGRPAPLPGESASDASARSTRVAVSSASGIALRYYQPPPAVTRARFCAICDQAGGAACVASTGVCTSGLPPTESSSSAGNFETIALPIAPSASGVLELTITGSFSSPVPLSLCHPRLIYVVKISFQISRSGERVRVGH